MICKNPECNNPTPKFRESGEFKRYCSPECIDRGRILRKKAARKAAPKPLPRFMLCEKCHKSTRYKNSNRKYCDDCKIVVNRDINRERGRELAGQRNPHKTDIRRLHQPPRPKSKRGPALNMRQFQWGSPQKTERLMKQYLESI